MIIPKQPFHTVESDCMMFSTNEADLRANGGYHILSTYTDTFTKWSFCVWLKAQTMVETMRALDKFLQKAPMKPKVILTDRGSEYESAFGDRVGKLGMKHKLLPAKSPGKHIERLNRSIRDAATVFRTSYQTKRVKDFVTTFVKRYNNQIHERTGDTPNNVAKMNEEGIDKVYKHMIK